MMKKAALRAPAALITSTALVFATATTANAAQVSGSCSTGGLSATANVNYTTTSGRHYVTSYSWTINGESGSTKNNVHVALRRSVTGPDQTLHSFTSADDVHNGYGYHTISPRLDYPSSYEIFGEFRFTFDRNNGADPYCVALTGRF